MALTWDAHVILRRSRFRNERIAGYFAGFIDGRLTFSD
jgi:hypothetical protein